MADLLPYRVRHLEPKVDAAKCDSLHRDFAGGLGCGGFDGAERDWEGFTGVGCGLCEIEGGVSSHGVCAERRYAGQPAQ